MILQGDLSAEALYTLKTSATSRQAGCATAPRTARSSILASPVSLVGFDPFSGRPAGTRGIVKAGKLVNAPATGLSISKGISLVRVTNYRMHVLMCMGTRSIL